jgi:hypothetical protein
MDSRDPQTVARGNPVLPPDHRFAKTQQQVNAPGAAFGIGDCSAAAATLRTDCCTETTDA